MYVYSDSQFFYLFFIIIYLLHFLYFTVHDKHINSTIFTF